MKREVLAAFTVVVRMCVCNILSLDVTVLKSLKVTSICETSTPFSEVVLAYVMQIIDFYERPYLKYGEI